jgi:hypothetical protein
MARAGTVIASIPAVAAVDMAGNGSTASTSTDNAVTYDTGATANSPGATANSPPAAAVTVGRCSSNTARGALNLRLSDADGDPLSLTLASNSNTPLLPNGKVTLAGSGGDRTLSVKAAAKRRGTAVLILNVSDGTVTVPVTITVKTGRRKSDVLRGTSGTDMIFGLGGSDRLNGRGGNDLLCGGKGPDRLIGGDGNDRLIGGKGNDRLIGGKGDDRLTGNAGRDRFSGGSGADVATDLKPAKGDKRDGTIP